MMNVEYRNLLSDGENGGGQYQMVRIVGDGLVVSDGSALSDACPTVSDCSSLSDWLFDGVRRMLVRPYLIKW